MLVRPAALALPLTLIVGIFPTEGVERSRVLQADNVTSERFVPREAFDDKGASLGRSDDGEAWTESNMDFGNQSTASLEPFCYHENASYYIVGEEGTLLEFWHPNSERSGGGNMVAVHLSIAANFVQQHRYANGTDSVRVKIVNAGWDGVHNASMDCEEENDCPALVLADTTNMVARYVDGDSASLSSFLDAWALEKGWVMIDDFIKYCSYDLTYNNIWIAVPLVSDIRLLVYNKTTFTTHDIEEPPGYEATGEWEWEDFVDAAEKLTLATGEPGWYFRGGLTEEMKLSLVMARNWGSTLYVEDDSGTRTCALEGNFAEALDNTTRLMLDEGWMSRDFVPTDTEEFESWLESGDEYEPFLCGECKYGGNLSELLGMAIVPPSLLRETVSEDLALAYVPGRYGYLGGEGLFLGNRVSDTLQDYAWELLEDLIENASLYALIQGSPPPFEKLLEDEVWLTEEWPLKVAQMRSSVPTQYPELGFPQFHELEEINPFRTMWMEMAHKDVNASLATRNVVAAVNEIITFVCTEDEYDHGSCNRCREEDYNYTLYPCDPATQMHLLNFTYAPADGATTCYGGFDMPLSVWVECDHVEPTSGFGIAIYAVSSIGGVLALTSAALVFVFRRRDSIKFSQPTFCVLFGLGVAGMCLSNISLVGENTVRSCASRFTIWGIAFDLAFGALFSKVYRVRRLVIDATSGRARTNRRSRFSVVAVVSLAVVVDLVVLTLWAVFDHYGPFPKTVSVSGYETDLTMTECASETSLWAITFIIFKVALVAWGVYLAWATRRMSYLLVEGREISMSIYLFAVLSAVLIFVGCSGLKVEYWALAKAFVFSLSSCTALVMVLVPKLWAAHKNMEVDMSVLTSSATTTMAPRGSPGAGADTITDVEAGSNPGLGCMGVGSISHGRSSSNVDGGGPWLLVCAHCKHPTESVLVANPRGRRNQPRSPKRHNDNHDPPAENTPATCLRDPRTGPTVAPAPTPALNSVPAPTPLGKRKFNPRSMFTIPRLHARPQEDRRGVVVHPLPVADEESPSPGQGIAGAADSFEALLRGSAGGASGGASHGSGKTKSSSDTVDDGLVGLALAGAGLVNSGRGGVGSAVRSPRRHKFRGLPIRSTSSSGATPEGSQLSRAERGGAFGQRRGTASRRSWRSSRSWRPSTASNISTASGQSELNAASFNRSLQAQAAALRAALWVTGSALAEQPGARWSGSSPSRRSPFSTEAVLEAEGSAHESRMSSDGGREDSKGPKYSDLSTSNSSGQQRRPPPLPRRAVGSLLPLEDAAGEEEVADEKARAGTTEGPKEPHGLQANPGRLILSWIPGVGNLSGSPEVARGMFAEEGSFTSIGLSSAASEASFVSDEGVVKADASAPAPAVGIDQIAAPAASPMHARLELRPTIDAKQIRTRADRAARPLSIISSFDDAAEVPAAKARSTLAPLHKQRHRHSLPGATAPERTRTPVRRPASANSGTFPSPVSAAEPMAGQAWEPTAIAAPNLRGSRAFSGSSDQEDGLTSTRHSSWAGSAACSTSTDSNYVAIFEELITPTPEHLWQREPSRERLSSSTAPRRSGIKSSRDASRTFSFSVSDSSAEPLEADVSPRKVGLPLSGGGALAEVCTGAETVEASSLPMTQSRRSSSIKPSTPPRAPTPVLSSGTPSRASPKGLAAALKKTPFRTPSRSRRDTRRKSRRGEPVVRAAELGSRSANSTPARGRASKRKMERAARRRGHRSGASVDSGAVSRSTGLLSDTGDGEVSDKVVAQGDLSSTPGSLAASQEDRARWLLSTTSARSEHSFAASSTKALFKAQA